ncbi:MAG: hypothetical protein Q9N62_08300 [Ghiorsea sp.]|nr:hypothetical protein [Ghiorsea sp.]
MNFKLLKIGLLCTALGLASCGGDSATTASSSNTTTIGSTAATTTVATNTGTVTVNTAPNNVVSIGASGTNFKTADATGKAVFSGLAAGAVDVHIFSADGYTAVSYMGINVASITDTVGFTGSVVDVYVQLVNPDNAGQSFYLVTDTNRYFGFQNTITGIVSFNVDDKPAGTAMTATVYAGQGAATSVNNALTVSGRAEVLNLGSHSFTTTAASGTAQLSLTANFAATLPTAPTLAVLQSVTPPTGMTVVDASFGYATVSGAPLALPDTIGAGMIGNDWNVSATNAGVGTFWGYSGTFAQGDTLTATATLTTPPAIAANQSGNVFTWTNGSTTQALNIVDIHDVNYTYGWTIYTPSGTSSITLPTVPTAATAPLTAGTAYAVDVFAAKEAAGASYEQTMAFVNGTGQFSGEFMGLTGVAYTR